MKYLIIGAGGTGGCIGAFMAKAGKDVTLIARGGHLAAIQERGILLETARNGLETIAPIKAFDMEHYIAGHVCDAENAPQSVSVNAERTSAESSAPDGTDAPDVIFVCVKGYSLADVAPFIRQVAKPETVVIPILNIYGTGERLQKELPDLLVTDGCIYIAAQIKAPGHLWLNGDIFKVVFGLRKAQRDGFTPGIVSYLPILEAVRKDLRQSNIVGILSENIERDAFQKFSYVSPAAACGQYYNALAGDMQKPGEIRDTFAALIREIDALADVMGIPFVTADGAQREDIVKVNLNILDHLSPEASTSMQRDVAQGKSSEMDGLIFEVVRMGRQYQVPVPTYEKIAAALHGQGF